MHANKTGQPTRMENYKMFIVIKTASQNYLWESSTHTTALRVHFSSLYEKVEGHPLSQFDTEPTLQR
jgi:hypothetical protein